jgi:acyl transferase domain-containing protein/SAM-dependent methyltransferase/acyl carrier protein
MNDPIDPAAALGIAVVGMAGRFPDASDVAEFWSNLAAGRESIRPLSAREYLAAGGDPDGLDDPNLVRSAAVIDGVELFDAEFFGLLRSESELMDPQHRIFLECCHHALENAGCDPYRYTGAVGTYAGCAENRYFLSNVYPELARSASSEHEFWVAGLGNNVGFFATRVAFELGLTGPAISVQTGCSTSLVAVHLAVQDLLSHRCDTALAGGACINPLAKRGYRYVDGGPQSPDGHCRAFDAASSGIVSGDGVGVVVLKRLADALADGDHIWAVIKGSAVNNDGRRKLGFSAPSVAGQAEVILAAQAVAGVDADSISYIEAHGTGTPLGDPIEIAALTQAFRASTDRRGFCHIGSLKPNIGHCDAAAGVVSLIKTVLALYHQQIPASPHPHTPNPEIDLGNSPFLVNTELTPWQADNGPRRAGVTALTAGGTNAHVILQEAPPAPPRASAPAWSLLPVSAKSPAALAQVSDQLARHLAAHPDLPLADVAHTLQVGRRVMPYRRTVVARDLTDAATALAQSIVFGESAASPSVAYLFTGAGSHHHQMARGLYDTETVFQAEMDRASSILSPHLGRDLRAVIYEGEPSPEPWSFAAVVATGYALARTFMAYGASPTALLGHSLGEYTAACVAEVMSLDEALPLLVERERLFTKAGGATLGVALPYEELSEYLTDPLCLAAVNAPAACTVSGPVQQIEELEQRLRAMGADHIRLRLSAAMHNRMLEPVLGKFAQALSKVTLKEPSIPIVSNRSGTWIQPGELTVPQYWVRHATETVRFATGLQTLHRRLLEAGRPLLVEVGPGGALSRFAREQISANIVTVRTMRHPDAATPDRQVFLSALGDLWRHGVSAKWSASGTHQRRRVPLPGHPFNRKRFWIDAPSARPGTADSTARPPQEELRYVIPQGLRDDNYTVTRGLVTKGARQLVIVDPDLVRALERYPGDATQEGQMRSAPSAFTEQVEKQEARLRAAQRRSWKAGPYHDISADARSILDRLAAHYVCCYLRQNGVSTTADTHVTREDLLSQLGATAPYHKFVDVLIGFLHADGIVVREPGGIRFVADCDTHEITALEHRVEEVSPEAVDALRTLKSCVAEYSSVIRKKKPGAAVLIPDGNTSLLESVGDVAPRSRLDIYLTLLIDEIVHLIRAAGGERVRILEVGSGSGHLTWPLAERIRDFPGVEFHVTDLGRSFVTGAQREARKRGIDFMTFGVLDVSRDGAEQGYAVGEFDIALAFNVVHATTDLHRSVRNMHNLLVPGGVFALVEAISVPRIVTMTTGLLEGWWLFEDELRSSSPLIPPHQWRKLLTGHGFDAVTALPNRVDETDADHGLIIGRRCLSLLDASISRVRELELLGAKVSIISQVEVAAPPELLNTAQTTRPSLENPPRAVGEDFNHRPQLHVEYTAPSTEEECLIARQWQEILGLDRVGVHDSFLDLGGDSLTFVQVATRLRNELGVNVSVRKLLQDPTVYAIAQELQKQKHIV